MAEAFDPMRTLATTLAEHGPLHEDDITRRLRGSGVADPDTLLDEVLDETECPARQLVDDRWVWLPTVLAGRVFTHRLGADEAAHDVLTVTPNLDPITALCEHEQYGRLADGSAARIVLAGFDEELLEQRGIPPEVVDPLGALLLAPGTLAALGVAEGDLVGVRLTAQGLVVERVTAPPRSPGVGAAVGGRLAATLDADEPVYFDAAVWTACVEDPAVFTEPLPPCARSSMTTVWHITASGSHPGGSISPVGVSSVGAQRWPSDMTSTPTTRSRCTRWSNCTTRCRCC